GDYRQVQEKRLTEDRNASLSASLSDITETTDPYRMLLNFQDVRNAHIARGGTGTEAAKAFFDHIAGLSIKNGGRPDLFDVFDQEVPGLGKKLVDLVPGLKDQVATEKHSADVQLKRELNDTLMDVHGEQRAKLDKMVEDGTLGRMGEEGALNYLKQFTGPTGALHADGIPHYMAKVRAQAALEADKAQRANLLVHGLGSLLSEKDGKEVIKDALDRPMGAGGASVMQTLVASLTGPGDPAAFSAATNAIISAHQTSGVWYPDDRLKHLVESVSQEVPKDGTDVSPKVQGLAKLYAAMERESKPLLNSYFDDKTRAIFSAYNRMTVEGQVSSPTAWKRAFAMVDPENIKNAEARMKDPAMVSAVHDAARSATRAWITDPGKVAVLRLATPAFLGMKPDTADMEHAALTEATRYKTMVPDATNDEIKQHIDQWSAANYMYEKSTNRMLPVPPAYNTPATAEAVANYLDIVKGNNKDMNPRLVDKGNGVYDLFFYPRGVPEKVADNVSLDAMLSLRTAQKNFMPSELAQYAAIRNKITAGTATAEDLKGAESVLAKARTSGLFTPAQQSQAEALAAQAAQQKTVTNLEPALHTAVGRGEFNPAAAIRPNGALTGTVSQQFLASGNLSGALTALAEGVQTRVYKDAAGHATIGIGYNLNANREHIAEDFRKANIPVEQIDEIKAGARSITTEQAMRLYQTVQPRYEAIAKNAVEARYPGEWAKLAPNVRAVFTDLAYQTGNVKQFSAGLDKVFAGDLSGSGLETKFKDRRSQQYKTDERRHTLRTSMLASTSHFQALLSNVAKQPADAISARVARAGSP
ncbi:MAG: glycoside hydrolase family protein, partial [Usitatibacter sp.]